MLDRLRRLFRPAACVALAWALALALVGSQTLGLAHDVVHGHDTAHHDHAGHEHEVHGADLHAHADHEHADHEPSQLFSDHEEGSAVCQLLDQAGHADALVAVAVQAADAPHAQTLKIATPSGFAQRHAAVYRARGPPTFLI